MIYRNLSLAALLILALNSGQCQPDSSNTSNTSGRSASANNSNRYVPPGANPEPDALAVPSLFSATPEQLRTAFNDYVSRGEKGQKVSVGEEMSLSVTANSSSSPGTMKLRVLFLSPTDQARAKGYTFGLVAKRRTPDDRKAFENSAMSIISKRLEQVYFHVFLEQPGNEEQSIPPISFELLDDNGNRIRPTKQPTSYTAGRDIIGSVALAEEGQPLIFPLYSGTKPLLTNRMDRMRLSVRIGDSEQQLEYRLQR